MMGQSEQWHTMRQHLQNILQVEAGSVPINAMGTFANWRKINLAKRLKSKARPDIDNAY